MVKTDRMSFHNHLPNCVCSKCGNKRETMSFRKKNEGKWVPEEVNIEEFNSQVIERYEVTDGKFHYRGKFTA